MKIKCHKIWPDTNDTTTSYYHYATIVPMNTNKFQDNIEFGILERDG